MDEAYQKHRAQLDDILLNGSPAELKQFMRRLGMQVPSTDEVLEATFHKTITAALTLPIEHRRQSKQWLEVHGYHSWDDGDL